MVTPYLPSRLWDTWASPLKDAFPGKGNWLKWTKGMQCANCLCPGLLGPFPGVTCMSSNTEDACGPTVQLTAGCVSEWSALAHGSGHEMRPSMTNL